jgi:plasmid stabilization system protein ParE
VLVYEYDMERDQVSVLRILHGRRGITEKLLRR